MHDLSCVVHLHSLHSDGTGTVDEIVRAARRAGVDVVLLTTPPQTRRHGGHRMTSPTAPTQPPGTDAAPTATEVIAPDDAISTEAPGSSQKR